MSGQNTAVLGVYSSYGAVERAVDILRDTGFRSTDISVLFPANVASKDFAFQKNTKAPEGATAGGGTGAVVGGFAGALVGMGIPEYEATRYAGRVHNGGILLSVHSDDPVWTKIAADVLNRTGAEDVASTDEMPGDFGHTNRPTPRATA